MRHPTELHNGQVAWSKIRILVFGMDDDFRFLVRSTFRRLGIREVSSTTVPADAPTMLGRGVDIVLLDLGNQVEDGVAFLGRMRGTGNAFDDIPVLAVAPADQKPAVERCRALGIEGMVPKPISGHELVKRVSDTLIAPKRMAPPDSLAPKPKIEMRKVDAPLLVDDAPKMPIPPAVAAGLPPIVDELAAARPGTARMIPSPAPPPPPAPPPSPHGGSLPGTGSGGSAAPAARPAGGRLGGDDIAPARRPSGGTLSADDLAGPAARPSGGKIAPEDIAAAKVLAGKLGLDDLAGTAPAKKPRAKAAVEPLDDDDPAAKAAAERRRKAWEEEVAAKGHKTRTGKDVAAFDVSAVVAEHVSWLQSQGAQGKRANLEGMDLASADLSKAVLANATLRRAELSDANMAEARLDGADLRHAVLSAANLSGANLGVASLRHANLAIANLEGAVLRGTDLSGATFRGARLEGADFKGAMLVSTDLREADLSRVDNLTQAQVDKAVCDMSTRLPPGVFRPAKDEA
ncbi:MAG: pentapeptide repeat-containing protein [Actinomycetota bacterium]